MPPVLSSRRVLPAGHTACTLQLGSPNLLNPPSFTFAFNTDVIADVNNTVMAWISGAGADNFLDRLYPDYSVDRLIARTDTNSYELPINLPGTGVGADLLTPAVAALVKLTSATSGRRGSGRMYWPGCLNDTDVDNSGRIAGGTLTSLQLVAERFLTEAAAVGIDLVLLHSYSWPYGTSDPGPPVGFPSPSIVTGVIAQSVVATQRRRQR